MPPPKLSPHAGSAEVASPACSHGTKRLEAFGVAVTTALETTENEQEGAETLHTSAPHTALLQELRSDLRFLCPFCVHRKYKAMQAVPARKSITGPLFFPP